MKRLLTLIMVLLLTAGSAYGADSSESGIPTSPLKIYSGGFATGALMSLNKELRDDVSRQFFRVSFANLFSVRDNVGMFLDVDLLFPALSGGANLGVDINLAQGEFRPFVGIGGGAHFIDRDESFGNNFGPSFTAHGGFALDLTENVAVRMRLPYHIIFNERRDHVFGADFGFLFSSKYKKVRKLDYN
jgi:opacity protein-like surface antigen